MKFIKLSLVFPAAIMFAAACSSAHVSQNTANVPAAANQAAATQPAPTGELTAARELYSKRCINCHRETGEGGPKEIEGVKIKAPNFKDPRLAAETDKEYVEQIEKGGDGMPAYKGKITDDEIKSLVRFIRQEFQGK